MLGYCLRLRNTEIKISPAPEEFSVNLKRQMQELLLLLLQWKHAPGMQVCAGGVMHSSILAAMGSRLDTGKALEAEQM